MIKLGSQEYKLIWSFLNKAVGTGVREDQRRCLNASVIMEKLRLGSGHIHQLYIDEYGSIKRSCLIGNWGGEWSFYKSHITCPLCKGNDD